MGDMREKRKRKKQAKTRLTIILLVVVIAILVVLVYLLVFWKPADAGDQSNSGTTAGSAADGSGADTSGVNGSGGSDSAAVTPAPPGSELSYYDPTRADRYDAFSAANPDIAFDDVVWMVDVDLDKAPYEDPQPVPDPTSLTLLVNKHYNLPEDFTPPDLVSIGKSMMRQDAADAMNVMISAASAEGLNLWVQSGFRSYDVQKSLYEQYTASDGADVADTYSARPGHSEHQTGLAADLNTITDAFGDTKEGQWVAENCWQYGFIVRYTAENTGLTLYKPEPWHVRYIGIDNSTSMHELGFSSYEEYWVKNIRQ